MSRNLYKYIQELEKRVDSLELKCRLLENNVDHLETLLRLKDKLPERPFYPNPTPELPWYKATPTWMDNNDSITETTPITCSVKFEEDPFVKIMKGTFGI